MESELHMTPTEEREKLLHSISTIHISAEHSLAMKANLQIPWNKLRLMRRWMKSWNIQIASERSLRERAANLVIDEFVAEEALFSSGDELKSAPIVYVPHLKNKIFDLLNKHDNLNNLTWHEGRIPADEIWIKLGGDKGDSSLKTNFQILNVENPNAVNNTCVFTAFQAPDSYYNLKIALERYGEQVDELQKDKWNGKKLVFLSGDYEFLCNVCGLSGASGKHCCLWCLVTQEKLRSDNDFSLRTLESIKSDNSRFIQSGGNPKNVKFYNNAIRTPIFNIPLTQVCLN
jgi:hypothetical protein